jgi:hypothetical protein
MAKKTRSSFRGGSVWNVVQRPARRHLPTSYWPLDDLTGFSCHDELGLHNASAPAEGVNLAVIPFGASQAPYFDGALGSFPTIDARTTKIAICWPTSTRSLMARIHFRGRRDEKSICRLKSSRNRSFWG